MVRFGSVRSLALPVENQKCASWLCGPFDSTREDGFRGAIPHEDDIPRGQRRIRSLPREDLAEVNRRLRSRAAFLIAADNAHAALGGRPRKASTQGHSLQNRDLFIRFHCKSTGSFNRADHIYDSCASDLDDVSWIDHWIAAGGGRFEGLPPLQLN